MKNKTLLLFPVAILALIFVLLTANSKAAVAQTPPRKHALLIGISNYSALPHALPNQKEKSVPLFGNVNCDGDIRLIRAALIQSKGFALDPAKDKIVMLLHPLQTTRAAILQSFDKLVKDVNKGDVVFIHFSGVGSRVPNTMKVGGFEQTLVPADYKDDQSNEISFSELASALTRIADKKPAVVTVSLDANGGALKPDNKSLTEIGSSLHSSSTNRNVPFVFLSASDVNGHSYEMQDQQGKSVGRLSYVLSQAFHDATPRSTFRDVYERIAAIFAQRFSDQVPEIQGDIDTTLLGKPQQPPPPYIPVIVRGGKDRFSLSSNAGRLQGVTLGSLFALYAAGTKDFTRATPIAKATVVSVDQTQASLDLTPEYVGKVTPEQLMASRAVEEKHEYVGPPLAVTLPIGPMPPAAQAVVGDLRKLTWIQPADASNDLLLRYQPDSQSFILERTDGMVLADTSGAANPFQTLKQALERQSRWRSVLSLANSQEKDAIQMRIVPVETTAQASDITWKEDKTLTLDKSGLPQLSIGDSVAVELKASLPVSAGNDGPLYVTVLNLRSDGGISPVWPYPSSTLATPENTIPQDGEWHRLPLVLDISEPYGLQRLKAIATSEPADFGILWEHAPISRIASVPGNPSRRQAMQVAYTGSAPLWHHYMVQGVAEDILPLEWWATAEVAYQVTPSAGTLHILALGVEGQEFSAADAQAVADRLAGSAKTLFRSVDTRVLVNAQATPGGLQDAFQQTAAACKPNDTFVFYYSGRCEGDAEDARTQPLLSLTPSGAPNADPAAGITAHALRLLVDKIPAQKQWLMFDVGSPDRAFRAFTSRLLPQDDQLNELLGRQTVVFGSVGQRPLLRGANHGLLAESLLRGLAGEAAPDRAAADKLTVYQLEGYLKSKLLELSAGSERLASDEVGDDFSIELIPARALKPTAQLASVRGTEPVVSLPETAYHRQGKDYALLIGTNAYDNFPQLRNPLNDVDAVADELQKYYGFEKPDVLRDAKRSEIIEALKKYITKKDFADDDQLLIFVSGHGSYNDIMRGGVVITKDTQKDDVMDETDLSYTKLTNIVDLIPCKHIFLVLDVCFGGTIGEAVRGIKPTDKVEADITDAELIQRDMKRTARLYLTSGGKEYVPDGKGPHSPFAYRFLEALNKLEGKSGILRTSAILQIVQTASPQPCFGSWASNEPGSDFLFIANPK